MSDPATSQCPACGAEVFERSTCGSCGLDLRGTDAAALSAVGRRITAMDQEWTELAARRADAIAEFDHRRAAVLGAAPVSAPPPTAESPRTFEPSSPPQPEWSVERVRNSLLWLGATLLALSALTLTVVAWARLGAGGRAALLVGMTALACAGAIALRRRLPATSEAFTGLAIALALIDWQAMRRAGAGPGVSDLAWWAVGTGVVGAFALILGRTASRNPARVAMALLFPASALLTIAVVADAAWSFALAFALLSAALVVAEWAVATRVDDRLTSGLLRLEAVVIGFAAFVAAVTAAALPNRFVDTLTPAAILLGCGLGPALAAIELPGRRPWTSRTFLAALTVGAAIGAIITLGSELSGAANVSELSALAALGAVAVVVAPWVPEPWRRGSALAGAAAIVPGLAPAFVDTTRATFGPLAWFDAAWDGSLDELARHAVGGTNQFQPFTAGWTPVAVLVATAVAAAGAAIPHGRRRPFAEGGLLLGSAVALALFAVDLAPVVGDDTVLVALAVTTAATAGVLIGSSLCERRFPAFAVTFALMAFIPAVPAAGWASVTPRASITALVVAVIAAAIAASLAQSELLRSGHAATAGVATVALAGVVTAALQGEAGPAGFAVAIAASAIALFGVFLRRDTVDGVVLEATGVAGILIGAGIASASPTWLAGTLTAVVPLVALGALRRDRSVAYGIGATTAALAATWAWLAAADVHTLEAYTLPAAAVALGAGAIAWKMGYANSWLTLGPAIVIGLGPTLAIGVADDDVTRAAIAGVAALVIVLLGAARRLQAPIALGSIALLVLAVDTAGPAAARLPRWIVLGTAGALLLFLGATFERRRDDARRARGTFLNLG